MAWDNSLFNTESWKLTLPVDEDYFSDNSGSVDYTNGTAYEVKGEGLEGFEAEEFFSYDENIGAMIFTADVDSAKTSSATKYGRSELREMDGEENAAWSIADGGTMSSTLAVTEMPTEDGGGDSRVIVNQIHGEDDELVRVYYAADGTITYANEITGDDGQEREFHFENADGERINVPLGETFSSSIDVSNGELVVQISYEGEVYSAVPTDGVDPTAISEEWLDDSFYFKAGVYMAVNDVDGHAHEGSGTASAAFFDVDVSHEPGGGMGAWAGTDAAATGTSVETTSAATEIPATFNNTDTTASMSTTADVGKESNMADVGTNDVAIGAPSSSTAPMVASYDDYSRGTGADNMMEGDANNNAIRGLGGMDTLNGGAGDDLVKGGGQDDIVKGGVGDDVLWGNDGNDTLHGGDGADWMKGGKGTDIFSFDTLDGQADTVADFRQDDNEKLDVSTILQGLGITDAVQEGYVQFEQDGSDTRVFVDLDGIEGLGDRVELAILEGQDAKKLSSADLTI